METGEIIEFPEARMTSTRLLIPENTTFERWKEIGRKLKAIEGAVQFYVGDWVNFGANHWQDLYAHAAEALGYERQTIEQFRYVASRIPELRRRNFLSYSHHAEVAALAPEIQDKLLQEAGDSGDTVVQLRGRVHLYKEEHNLLPPPKPKPEAPFEWSKETHVADMLDGMTKIKDGVFTLIHDMREPDTRKYYLEMVRKLILEVLKEINNVLGEPQ